MSERKQKSRWLASLSPCFQLPEIVLSRDKTIEFDEIKTHMSNMLKNNKI